MKEDRTTPAVVGLLESHPDESFSVAEIAIRANLNPGTVSGWISKKLDRTQIALADTEDGTRKYQFDPTKVISDTPRHNNGHRPRKNQRMIDKVRAQQAPRRKAGAIYAELIWREGNNCALILPSGELIKGQIV